MSKSQAAEKQRPIDRAIRSAEVMLNYLRMVKQANYPPAAYAQTMQAIHAHSQTKFHIDAELAAQSHAWARANSPGHVVPPAAQANAAESIDSFALAEGSDAVPEVLGRDTLTVCENTKEAIRSMGFGKIPVEAA
jgi:hypothetical protein